MEFSSQNQIIVENIRRMCKNKHTSLTKLEVQLGMGNGVIGRWAKGKRLPSTGSLIAVADALGVTVDDLMSVYTDETKIEKSPTHDVENIQDEASLNMALLKRLTSLSPSELDKVDSFVQGMIANRKE